MNSLQNFNYNGSIIQKRQDGYINMTQMCSANGKLVADFLRLKQTKAYLAELSTVMGIPITQLYQVIQGGNEDQGTWGHPLLSLRCAQWINAQFAVWCDGHIFHLMETGETNLGVDPLEEIRLKIRLTELEAQKETAIAQAKQADLNLVHFRYTITTTCPEPVQQKILGYTTITPEPEYRDRLIKDDQLINDGSTISKRELCERYGLKTRTGNPDYKRLNSILTESGLTSDKNAWGLSAYIQENYQLKRDFVPALDEYYQDCQRNLFIGE